MVGQYQIFKVAFPRPPLQPTFSLTHRHIRTYTHILSLSPSVSLSIIAHDARTINESSTVNKKGENKTLCGALLTVVEVEVEVGEERRRRGGGGVAAGDKKKQLGHRYRSITRKILVFFLFSLFLSCHLLLLLRSPLEHGR